MLARTPIVALALLALAACGKAAPPPAGKAAGADVVAGTISDAMLDTDRSRTMAPMQPVKARAKPGASASDAAEDAPDDADPAAPDSAVKPQ